MRPLALLWNHDQRRLRAPWRIALQVVVLALLGLAAGVGYRAVQPPLLALVSDSLSSPALDVLSIATVAVVAFGGVWLGSLVLDRRRFADYGFHVDRAWWLDFGFGLALGAVLVTAVFLVELAAGWVAVVGTGRARFGAFVPSFVAVLLVFVAVALYEELLLRGFLLRNLAEGLVFFDPVSTDAALVAATVVSSLVFGGLHFLNPNATTVSSLAVAFGGVFLATGYLLTGELAVPVGVHLTWNLFQGPVYGFPVSGGDFGVSLLVVSRSGPAALTGGPFGPEAGFLGIASLVVGIVATVWWVRRRTGSARLDDSLVVPDLRWS